MKPYLRMSFWDNLDVIKFSSKPKPDFSNQLHRGFSSPLIPISLDKTPVYPNLLSLTGDGPELSPFRTRREVLTEIQLEIKY